MPAGLAGPAHSPQECTTSPPPPCPACMCRFVFEGKAPELKREELAKRSNRREDANTELEAAKEVH